MRFGKIAIFIVLLAFSATSMAVDFSTHGYYRTRIVGANDLDLQKPNYNIAYPDDRLGFIAFNQMRLRLNPTLKLNDNISIHATFDILDNVLYGTNKTSELNILSPAVGTLVMPAGAGSFSMVGSEAGENGSINVRRVWMDLLTPIGKFRLGRQPVQWGLGILQNDGNGMQDDFGDTSDAITYLAQLGTGRLGTLTGGLFWGIPYEAQSDPRTTGFAQSLREMPANSRDGQNYAAMLIWDKDEDLTLGLFAGARRRNGRDGQSTMYVKLVDGTEALAGLDGDTLLFFGDLYAKYIHNNYKFQFEGAYINGKISTGIALDQIGFSGVTVNTPIINLSTEQQMSALLAAFEVEAKYDFGGEWKVQAGYASGDANPLSSRITQLGFRPDYRIALMMFNMPLGTSPTYRDSTSGDALGGGQWITGNYINNALYFTFGYMHNLDVNKWIPNCDMFKVGGKVITAWAPQRNINVDFSELIPSIPNLPYLAERTTNIWQRWYGVELDLSLEAKFYEHLSVLLDAGVLFPGREYDIDVQQIDLGSLIKPIPYNRAAIGWMGRLTIVAEF